jgi:hypothetical protein
MVRFGRTPGVSIAPTHISSTSICTNFFMSWQSSDFEVTKESRPGPRAAIASTKKDLPNLVTRSYRRELVSLARGFESFMSFERWKDVGCWCLRMLNINLFKSFERLNLFTKRRYKGKRGR